MQQQIAKQLGVRRPGEGVSLVVQWLRIQLAL